MLLVAIINLELARITQDTMEAGKHLLSCELRLVVGTGNLEDKQLTLHLAQHINLPIVAPRQITEEDHHWHPHIPLQNNREKRRKKCHNDAL